jgi:hypothetical protein
MLKYMCNMMLFVSSCGRRRSLCGVGEEEGRYLGGGEAEGMEACAGGCVPDVESYFGGDPF